jgi:AAA domain
MSRETCRCGRPMLTRPGDIEATCAECHAKPDYCPCSSLRAAAEPGIELELIAGRYIPVDWPAAWASKPETVDWLVKPFIEAGTVNALYATPGTGKSLIALEWALRLARAGRTAVYIDEENRLAEDIVDRLQAMGAEPGELGHLVMYSFAALPPLDTPLGGLHLLALAVTAGAELVIIDTASRMIAGGENDSDTWLKLYACSIKPLKGRGIAVLRIDHPGKDAERGQRGSSAKNGDVDTVWRLSQIERGSHFYRMDREKSRSGHGEEAVQIERRYAPLRHVWEEKTVRTGGPQITPLGQLCGQLFGVVPPSAGRDRCRTALDNAGITASNSLLSEVVKHRKEGCNCPSEWRTGRGQVGQAVTRPPTVRASPTRSGGDSGQVSGDPPPDVLDNWPADTIGATENLTKREAS